MMKKRLIAISLTLCFGLTACSSTTETTSEMTIVPLEEENKEEVTVTVASAYSSPIVTTGQTDTYDADGAIIDTATGFYGQDGDYDSLEFSFTLNDNGTTTDNNTGLTWVTNPEGGKLTWDEAVEYVESLNTMVNDDGTVGFGGYTDWRLPSTEELFSISDFSVGWPYIDTDYFGFDESNSEGMSGAIGVGGSAQGGSPQGGSPQSGEEGELPEMEEGMEMPGMGELPELEEGMEVPGVGESAQGGSAQGGSAQGGSPQGGSAQGGSPQGGEEGELPEMEEGMEMPGMGELPELEEGMEMPEIGELPEIEEGMEVPAMGEDSGISKEEGQYWTSEYNQVEGDDRLGDIAFGVNHATGHIKAYPSDSAEMGKYVRAVRGDTYGEEDYTDNGDGTITDNASGLMWLEVDLGVTVDWEEALLLAESSEFAGYDDWRLPDVKELQSIVSYDGSYPAINQDYFTCTELEENENYYFWTSTSAYFSEMEPDYNSAWYVAFGYTSHGAGAVRFSPKYEGSDALSEGEDNILNSVRLVRDVD